MEGKVKTSIVINRELWEELKSKVGSEKGLKMLSKVVEEAIEDELCELIIMKALSKMLKPEKKIPLTIVAIKPKVPTNAGKVVRKMRESRT
ncbi:MAG: hypothetical protein B6U75_04575 [Desulfurococcales archaeon ex4484_217_1]|nr:MAG: hypothetical protein B6U75_04575 [Desulfurococcales archaeon ex4484_217_1]